MILLFNSRSNSMDQGQEECTCTLPRQNEDTRDTLFFYSKSARKPAGKGANEAVTNPKEYSQLNEITDWRKVLSNFYVAPFVYNGATYNTIEHALQSEKIRLVEPEKAGWFSVESGNSIGQGDGFLARKNSKTVTLNEENTLKWNEIKQTVLHKLLLAKFTQVIIARHAILSTRHAALLHRSSRGGAIQRQFILEQIRSLLQEL
jgi:predicted NAD-dependent protein-ADP-ribosyltransferase YbiA (DUF1768 family)